MVRTDDTRRRRAEILTAALACFEAEGYERTTLWKVRDRSGASIGSIYHHFGSKEEIFAALYLEAVADSQAAALRALRRADNLGDGVRALVRSYLRWVDRHRARAAVVLTLRRAELAAAAEARLEAMNEAFHAEVRTRLDALDEGLPDGPLDVLFASLVGPSEAFARRWLRGGTTTSLRRAADLLADAAARSLV
jgi:AcrR family transcriptional regulator